MEDLETFLASFTYAETTKRTYRDVIPQTLAHVRDTITITAPQLIQFINKKQWGNSRQCVALAACQKYLQWKHGHDHPALQARIKRVHGKAQRAITPEQAIQLLASFDPYKPKGARDLAICALAIDTGLRESELCRLTQADTDTEHRVLQVIAKGGQWKAAVFSEETAAHIERWKNYRKDLNPKGHLFVNIHTGEGLTPEGLYNIVEIWGKTIGIKLSPHDLRRTFATLATTLTNTPERVLMEGGGWKTSQMIHRYTKTITMQAMRKHLIIPALSRFERKD